ncbi:MAG: AMP-binding protein, partial [Gemmatimonadetes bacterium]|nr:AMP-binding protein [Gemmatimonadota bacterium]
ERAAARLRGLDVAGQRVGLLLPNLPALPVAIYGAMRAGASVLLLNPANSAREIREHLEDSSARTVLTSERLTAMLPAGVQILSVEELTATESGTQAGTNGEENDGDAEVVVVYTSANEGWARGARLSHRNLIANALSTVEAMHITENDRVIAALPLIHLFGLTVTLNAPLSVGAMVLPVERFSPGRILDLFAEARATVFCGVPAMYMALLAAAERKGVPEHALRVAICGGAPLPSEVGRRWEEVFGVPLREGYGLTEAGPVCLFNRVDRPHYPGTVGFPFPEVEVTIRDETGGELEPGEVGEICVRGSNVFLGYLGEEGRNPRDFHGDRLRTGDLASVEPGGAVRFRGFLKPMFTRSGFNVYPREVGRALEEDSRIERAVVCALPEPVKENEIVLYIRPAEGVSLTVEEVEAICSRRLAAYKQPGRIFIEREEGRRKREE